MANQCTPSTPAQKPLRMLLKLSGEAFCSSDGFGIDPGSLSHIAEEIRLAYESGVQLAVVVGGGNIIRGADLAASGDIEQSTADYMGMLGTVINGSALREKLVSKGIDSRVMSALEIRAVAEPFIRNRAIRHLEKGRVVILVAGTGNPFFTTDTCAALRATELGCSLLLKATKVDGVYSADPNRDNSATRYERLTFDEALAKGLEIMDLTAIAMCRERNIPVRVFKFEEPGNIARVIAGESIGTLIEQPRATQSVRTHTS
ncbi:MAG TPA: UMP kinase [Phycisphaerales bacterium]|nr:UMP kinase [Phycisphaerales bacterium]